VTLDLKSKIGIGSGTYAIGGMPPLRVRVRIEPPEARPAQAIKKAACP
jgi:hypothetical protein